MEKKNGGSRADNYNRRRLNLKACRGQIRFKDGGQVIVPVQFKVHWFRMNLSINSSAILNRDAL